MNLAILVGRIGKDAQSKEIGNGYVINFSVATSERYKNKEGKQVDNTEWHNISYFVKSDALTQYLKKGTQVSIQGKIQTDKYEQEGITKYSTKVIAKQLELLGGGNSQGSSDNSGGDDFDDQLPF